MSPIRSVRKAFDPSAYTGLMFAKAWRKRYVVTSQTEGAATELLHTTDPGDAQVAAQKARTTAARNSSVRITRYLRNKVLAFEDLSPIDPSALNDAEVGTEVVFDILGQAAGLIYPCGERGWGIKVSNPMTPQHMPNDTVAPALEVDQFHNTHQLARDRLLQLWSDSLDARLPPPEHVARVDVDFQRMIDTVHKAICDRAANTPVAGVSIFGSTSILFGSKDGVTLEDSPMPAHIAGPGALSEHMSAVAAAEHYPYLTALHGGVQRLLPDPTEDGEQTELAANPTLVFISVGPGRTVAHTAHLREQSGHVGVGKLILVGLDDTHLTGAMDAAALAALERHF